MARKTPSRRRADPGRKQGRNRCHDRRGGCGIQAVHAAAEETARQLAEQKDQYLRLLAEYDNYRKRSQKEKEFLYADGLAAAVLALLPVYDNLERALKQETADEAYRKGVEMTMNQLKEA
jgi:molecular chaperone GrpE